MIDPVITADGLTYERTAIVQWLQTHKTDPRTNKPLAHKHLIPNIDLRILIQEWWGQHGPISMPFSVPIDVTNTFASFPTTELYKRTKNTLFQKLVHTLSLPALKARKASPEQS